MIVYHGVGWVNNPTYFNKDTVEANEKYNILVSFASRSAAVRSFDLSHLNKIFLDSGAFSAWNSGKTIEIDKYIEFLNEYKSKVEVYANLDAIGDPDKSFENYIIMKEAGLDPLPVYHKGSDIKYLYKYLKYTNYVGLGGMVGQDSKEVNSFIQSVFRIFPKLENNKFHGFGISSPTIMKKYPWYSVDSTAGEKAGYFGRILTPWGLFDLSDRVKHLRVKGLKINKLEEWIESRGFSLDVLTEGGNKGTVARIKLNLQYIDEISQDSPKEYKPKVNHLL